MRTCCHQGLIKLSQIYDSLSRSEIRWWSRHVKCIENCKKYNVCWYCFSLCDTTQYRKCVMYQWRAGKTILSYWILPYWRNTCTLLHRPQFITLSGSSYCRRGACPNALTTSSINRFFAINPNLKLVTWRHFRVRGWSSRCGGSWVISFLKYFCGFSLFLSSA